MPQVALALAGVLALAVGVEADRVGFGVLDTKIVRLDDLGDAVERADIGGQVDLLLTNVSGLFSSLSFPTV
jgi:hypothetical protein